MKKIILGSQSPRRQKILADAGYAFELGIKEVEEIYPDDLKPEDVPEYLAKLKASAFTNDLSENQIVITADTVVILNDKIIGKPKSKEDAIQTITELSGTEHKVISGVCIIEKSKQISFSELTLVKFRDLNKQMIEHYVEKFQPFDKAGSYAIQEWIGLVGIEYIKGNYYNVLGLPMTRLINELELLGITLMDNVAN